MSGPGPSDPIEKIEKELNDLVEQQKAFITNEKVATILQKKSKQKFDSLQDVINLLKHYMLDYAITEYHMPAHMLRMGERLVFLEEINRSSEESVKTKIVKEINSRTDKPFDEAFSIIGADRVSYRRAIVNAIRPAPGADIKQTLAAIGESSGESFEQAERLADQLRESSRVIERLQIQVRELTSKLATEKARAVQVALSDPRFDKLRELLQEYERTLAASSITSAAKTGNADGSSEGNVLDRIIDGSIAQEDVPEFFATTYYIREAERAQTA